MPEGVFKPVDLHCETEFELDVMCALITQCSWDNLFIYLSQYNPGKYRGHRHNIVMQQQVIELQDVMIKRRPV